MIGIKLTLFIANIVLLVTCVYLYYLYKEVLKQVHKLKNYNTAKSFFVHKLGHELKNPLNGIVGFSEMLVAGYYDELAVRQKERVEYIRTCGYQLQDLIEELIILNKGAEGFMEILENNINIKDLIDGVFSKEVKHRIKINDIKLLTDFTCKKFGVKGDIRKLSQMLKNIIDNAIKFTPKGGQITIKDDEINGVISISDTGCGMCADEIVGLFLAPGDMNKLGTFNGVGIGMPLAKLIADLHDIELIIDSIEQIGTTVKIIFPEKRIYFDN